MNFLAAAAIGVLTAIQPLPVLAVGSSDGASSESSASDANYKAAEKLIGAKKYREAIPLLVAIVEAEPRNANAWNLLAYSNRKISLYDNAGRYYARALTINPRHLGALEYQGELFLEIGQPDKAKANLQKLKTICGSCEEWQDLQDAIKAAGV